MMEAVLPLEKTITGITQHAMGTVMAHHIHGEYAGGALAEVCEEIAYLEELLSRFLPDSDIGRLNTSAGMKSVKVNPETFDLLAQAIDFASRFPGCFDPTITPLVDVWQHGKQTQNPPDEEIIRRALSLVNHNDVILDAQCWRAGLRRPGQSLDLGGIAKGLAGDRVRQVLDEYEIKSAYSNLGGNVVTLGTRPDGSPWRIGIQHPRDEGRLLGAVSVAGRSVVTSGDYQRYFIDSHGMRRHHILNPQTGYPAESGLVSVTVVSREALVADALSTILFVAGLEQGLEYLKQFPQTEAVFVDSTLQVYLTGGLRFSFTAEHGIDVTLVE